ncbi:MAG: hypothetical protein IPO81_21170 [Kouleothrix sp.]|nr:hypothetical protein [Kouleothrix sp.]
MSIGTGTSTTAADVLPRALTIRRALLLAALCCVAAAWLAGPAGRLAAALPLLLFAPGYLVERALRPCPRPTAFLRPSLWLGLSLSLVALLYEWATALGLSLAPLAIDGLAAACGLGVLWRLWLDDQRRKTKDQTSEVDAIAADWPLVLGPWSWALLAVFALALWLRFYQIRDLALPAWVDSVHHALMIRVAFERGQAPLSLRPYLPVDQIPYHWGYHVVMAAALRLSGATLPQAMLWGGQLLNALHVLTVAALAAYLWRRPVAGVAAGITVGLLSIMPAYYVSWGRYTQLTGLLLLPAAMIAWRELLRAPSRRLAAALALLLAGMSLIHFLVLAFALCYMAVSGLVWALSARPRELRSRLAHAALGAGLALALAGPWLWSLASRALRPTIGRSQPLAGAGSYYVLDSNLLWAGLNRWLIALALLVALWAVWRRRGRAVEQMLWLAALTVLAEPWLALYLLPALGATLLLWGAQRRRPPIAIGGAALLLLNPATARLPYIAVLNNEVVVITLFIPIGVLLGGGAGLVWGAMDDGRSNVRTLAYRSWARIAFAVALAAVSAWGAWNMRDVVNPGTVLATQADVAALGWAAEHTPPDARYLISAAAWLGTGRGADGGWWLLPLTGRWTSTPPVVYDYGPPDYVRETRARTQQVMAFQAGQEQQLYQLIDCERITYVYLGPKSGALTPAAFPADQGFVKLYERDGATIFAVRRPAPPTPARRAECSRTEPAP